MALGKLSVVLDANIAKFESDTGRAARLAEKQAAAIKRSFQDAAKGIAGAFVGVFAIDKLVEFGKKTVDLGDQLNLMSQKAGVSAGTLSALKLEAERNGNTFDQLGTAMQSFARSVGAATYSATSQQAAAFKAMNISLTDAKGHLRDTQSLLVETSKKLSGYKDGIAKTTLAQQAFGRSGAELLPTLNALGRDGLEKVLDDAKALGVYFSEDAAKAATDYKEKMAELQAVVQGFSITISNQLIPVLAEGTATLVGVVKGWNQYSDKTRAASESSHVAAGAVAFLAKGFALLELAVKDAAASLAYFGQIGEAMMENSAMGKLLQGDIKGAFKASVNPFGQFNAAVKVAKQNWTSLLDTLAENNQEAMARFNVIDQAANAAKKVSNAIAQATGTAPTVQGNTGHTAAKVKAATDYTKALRDQVLALQLSAKQFELYQLAARGASNEDLDYASSLIDVRDRLKQQADAQKALSDFVGQHQAEIKGVTDAELQFSETMDMATKALDAHMVTWEQFQRIASHAVEQLNGHVEKQFDEMSEFAKQAARNMQDGFARFLYDPFKDGLKGMLGSFADTLRQMAAQALAAKVFDSIGAWGKANQGGGGWAGALASFASAFGGGRAGGGPVSAGGMYRVAENGPETLTVGANTYLMMGAQGGTVTPAGRGGARGITLIQNIQPTTTRRTADQVATATMRRLRMADARA